MKEKKRKGKGIVKENKLFPWRKFLKIQSLGRQLERSPAPGIFGI